MAQRKVHGLGDNVPFQLIVAPDTAEVDIYMPSAGVMGRLTGSGAHQVIPFADLPGGGGAASIIDITYADMQTAIAGSTLTEGQFYRITDATGTDLGFVCQAVKTNEITVNGTGGYLNADFQAVGDYAGTPETFNAQLGIWRTGFETITIPYTNLQFPADYVSYSTSSGLLDPAETFTTDLGTTGTVILDDGAGTVTVESLSQALVAGEVITGDTSGNTVTVDSYTVTVKTFQVGDTITGGITGATAVIITDDGSASMTAYMTSAGVAFDGSEALDNGAGVTADQNGAASSPTIVLGDVVIWNLLHWQLTDASLLNGTDPETNTAAYTLLDKATYPETYVTAWDVSEFDFANEGIVYRQDVRGGLVRGNVGVSGYQFGRDNCSGNDIQSPTTFDIRNLVAAFNDNSTFSGAYVSGIISGIDTTIENNILENGAQITGIITGDGCSISKNKFGQTSGFASGGIVMGNGSSIDEMDFSANSGMFDVTLGDSAQMSGFVLLPNASVSAIELGAGSASRNNILENGAQLTGITAGANCSISRNKIGQGATLGGSTTMGDSCSIIDNSIGNGAGMMNLTMAPVSSLQGNFTGPASYIGDIIMGNAAQVSGNSLNGNTQISGIELGDNALIQNNFLFSNAKIDAGIALGGGATMNGNVILNDVTLSNKTFDPGLPFNNNEAGITTDVVETITDNIESKRAIPGYSDIPGTLDISALTTLDCTAAWAQYRGIYNLTSSNATEAIDTITNFPTLFPFTLRPAAGLVLTVTGTPIATPIAAGQIALTTADIVLDGDKGEYLELVADPTNTYLVEKSRLTGIV